MTRFKQRIWKLVSVLVVLGFVAVVTDSAMARNGGGGGASSVARGGGGGGGPAMARGGGSGRGAGYSHGGGGHRGYSHAGGHRGYIHGGGHGYRWGGLALGIGLGSLYWPGYHWRGDYWPGYYGGYYPYPYAYPNLAYSYPASPATYIEQGVPPAASAPAQAQPQPQTDWYYCADARAYYPYVSECPGGWQRVPSTPPDWVAR